MSFLDDEEDEEKEEDQEVIDVEPKEVDAEPSSGGVITPVEQDLENVAQAFKAFDEVKSQLLESQDLQSISGNTFITKSGWRKIATAFGVSTSIDQKERVVEDGIIKYRVVAKATAPNGQSASGVGMCASNESNFTEYLSDNKNDDPDGSHVDGQVAWIEGAWRLIYPPNQIKEHDVYATAATRAKNRAISDLVGGGEVSAEEMSADQFID